MGLLEGILGSVMGGGNQASTGGSGTNQLLLQAALGMMQEKGGLNGILDAFKNNGMATHAASWVSTGDNHAVSGDQVTSALGMDTIAALAGKLGMSHGDASSGLAAMLPTIINQMTPSGTVPDNHHSMLQDVMGAMAKNFLK
jgi:uncharacterized protein YidB (DUF937 family)